MNFMDWLQIALYIVVLLLLVKPLGSYMAKVFQGERTFMSRVMGPVERLIYRILGIKPDEEMSWKTYALAFLFFNAIGVVVLFALR